MLARIAELADRNRYETAARLRDHAAAAIDVLWRGQRLRALASVAELVAARPDGNGGWQLAVIRCGQLAAAGVARRGVPPMPVVDAISAGAQAILPVAAPLGGALVEEVGADHALAGPAGCAHRAGRTRLGVTGGVGRAGGHPGPPLLGRTAGRRAGWTEPSRVRAAG